MDDVVTGNEVLEGRHAYVTIHSFSHIDLPLRPVLHAASVARRAWLHHRSVIGVTGPVAADPCHGNVTVGVRRYPGKYIRVTSVIGAHHDGRAPGTALSAG